MTLSELDQQLSDFQSRSSENEGYCCISARCLRAGIKRARSQQRLPSRPPKRRLSLPLTSLRRGLRASATHLHFNPLRLMSASRSASILLNFCCEISPAINHPIPGNSNAIPPITSGLQEVATTRTMATTNETPDPIHSPRAVNFSSSRRARFISLWYSASLSYSSRSRTTYPSSSPTYRTARIRPFRRTRRRSGILPYSTFGEPEAQTNTPMRAWHSLPSDGRSRLHQWRGPCAPSHQRRRRPATARSQSPTTAALTPSRTNTMPESG